MASGRRHGVSQRTQREEKRGEVERENPLRFKPSSAFSASLREIFPIKGACHMVS